MGDDADADLDRRLRDAFEPAPRASARVAEAALAGETRRWRRAWTAATAAAALCLAAAVALWPSGPATDLGRGVFPSGTLTDGLLVVPLPDGSVAISGGEARRGRPDDGYGIVIVEGELR
jgi:ferric-dicitrate binding protein FerR (iron transport regulator)